MPALRAETLLIGLFVVGVGCGQCFGGAGKYPAHGGAFLLNRRYSSDMFVLASQLRGGWGDLEEENVFGKLQSVKDQLIKAVHSGDKEEARRLAGELERIEEKAEESLSKRMEEDKRRLEEDKRKARAALTRAQMREGMLQKAKDLTLLEVIRGIEADRDRVEAERVGEEEAKALEGNKGGELRGGPLGHEREHGVGKCQDPNCASCATATDEVEDLEIESVSDDGVLKPLDLPYIFHYQRQADGKEPENAFVVLNTSIIPLGNNTYGELVRIGKHQLMLLEKPHEIEMFRLAKEYDEMELVTRKQSKRGGQSAVDAGFRALQRNFFFSQPLRELRNVSASGKELHIQKDLMRQVLEDMVWDGEAANVTRAAEILLRRSRSVGRWYSIRDQPSKFWWTDRPDKGVSVADDANTRLFHAAQRGNNSEVSRQVLLGADVKFHYRRYQNMTPMHMAAYEGWPDTVELLAGLGASVNATNRRGQTPLHMACSHGGKWRAEIPTDLVRGLPAVSLQAPAQAQQYYTPVPAKGGDWTKTGALAVARALIKLGVDVRVKDWEGNMAIDKARIHGRGQVRDYLHRVMMLDLQGRDPLDWRKGYARPVHGDLYMNKQEFEAWKNWTYAYEGDAERRVDAYRKGYDGRGYVELREKGATAAGMDVDEIMQTFDWEECHRQTLEDMRRAVADGRVVLNEDGTVASGLEHEPPAWDIDERRNKYGENSHQFQLPSMDPILKDKLLQTVKELEGADFTHQMRDTWQS